MRCVRRPRRRRRAAVGAAAAQRAPAAVRDEHHRRVRRLVRQPGRQPQLPRRLSEPQHDPGARRPDRAQQPHRARRARHGAADAFPSRPAVGHVHRHRAEGLHDAGSAADVDDRGQRPADEHSAPACTPTTSSARSPTSRSRTRRPSCDSRSRARRSRGRLRCSSTAVGAHDVDVVAARAVALGRQTTRRFASGTMALPRNPPPPVELTWSKYRGPGAVTFDKAHPTVEIAGGRRRQRAVPRQGHDDRQVQRAGRVRSPRHRERLLGRRRRRRGVLLDDRDGEGVGDAVISRMDSKPAAQSASDARRDSR